MANTSQLTKSSGILTLLENGCAIVFPWGYEIKGDPEFRYIDCTKILAGERFNDGLENLNRDGVKNAIQSALDWKKEQENGE